MHVRVYLIVRRRFWANALKRFTIRHGKRSPYSYATSALIPLLLLLCRGNWTSAMQQLRRWSKPSVRELWFGSYHGLEQDNKQKHCEGNNKMCAVVLIMHNKAFMQLDLTATEIPRLFRTCTRLSWRCQGGKLTVARQNRVVDSTNGLRRSPYRFFADGPAEREFRVGHRCKSFKHPCCCYIKSGFHDSLTAA